MSRAPWLLPAAVVLFATAVPLAKVGVDRSGEPRMSITVTQRELMQRWGRNEDSGELLTWSWGVVPELDSLTAADLEALGFDCREEEYDCGIRSGRNGWIVVTLDTVPWQRALDSTRHLFDSLRAGPVDSLTRYKLQELIGQLDQQIRYASRLRTVAVGDDPAALTARYADGAHLVLAAKLRPYRSRWSGDSRDPRASLYRIHADPTPAVLYVPNAYAAAVRDTGGYRDRAFAVTVTAGQGWLPTVREIVPLPPLVVPTLRDTLPPRGR
jgi:hypothetical protein